MTLELLIRVIASLNSHLSILSTFSCIVKLFLCVFDRFYCRPVEWAVNEKMKGNLTIRNDNWRREWHLKKNKDLLKVMK